MHTLLTIGRMHTHLTDTLSTIPHVDFPELRIDEHESTEMPFRYVAGSDEKPVMPEVSQPPTEEPHPKVS